MRSTATSSGRDRLGLEAQASTSEDSLERHEADEDVDDRLRGNAIRGCHGCCSKHLDERVVPSLRVGAGQFRCRRIRPELGRPGSDVLGELGVDELLEDADQFGGDHAGAARCPDADRAVDVEHRGAAAIVRDLVVALGSVEVGERLPPARDDTEVVVREMLGVAQQGRRHRVELVADSRVRRQPSDFVGLRHADVTLRERIHQLGHDVERPRQLA